MGFDCLHQFQIWLMVSWTLCLNWCTQRWLKLNPNLVNNWIYFRLWQLKMLLPEGQLNFKCPWKSTFEPRSSCRCFCVTVLFIILILNGKRGWADLWKLQEKIASWACVQGVGLKLIFHWNAEIQICLNHYVGWLLKDYCF